MMAACAFFARKNRKWNVHLAGFSGKIDAADYLNAFLTSKIPRNLTPCTNRDTRTKRSYNKDEASENAY